MMKVLLPSVHTIFVYIWIQVSKRCQQMNPSYVADIDVDVKVDVDSKSKRSLSFLGFSLIQLTIVFY